jgi:hypothetical protein
MLKYWNLFDKPVVNNSSQGKVENINAFKSLPYHLVSFPVRVGVCAVMGFVQPGCSEWISISCLIIDIRCEILIPEDKK